MRAQSGPCGPLPITPHVGQQNIFSPQQEQWLGEAMADYVERDQPAVRDDGEHAYLQSITDRLLAVLPPTGLRFQVMVVDTPEINGFSLAGGRIYVTRKLIVSAANEDQVAGVLGHEIGHIVSHQFAENITAEFARRLQVNSVSDRADIYTKFQRLLDAKEYVKASRLNHDENEQEADRIAVYLMSAAGYQPKAYYDFWNSSFFVEGKTGNRLSDFFHTTTVEQKRLRGIQAMSSALPPGCGSRESSRGPDFVAWQASVLANQKNRSVASASVGKVVALQPLHPRLRQLHFSRDGSRLLAQDESGIFVLQREPLQELFRIEAPQASGAQWSPDSQEITFLTSTERVEHWSVTQKKQVAAFELHLQHPCIDSQLSPDGRTLACVSQSQDGLGIDFNLIDVASSTSLFQRAHWFSPSYDFRFLLYAKSLGLLQDDLFPRAISADGQTMLFGFQEEKVGFDLRTRSPIKLGHDLLHAVDRVYVFQGNDAVLSSNPNNPKRSGTYGFPDGAFKPLDIRFVGMEAATDPGLVLVHDVQNFETALADLNSGKFNLGSHGDGLDVQAGIAAIESLNGDVILMQKDGKGIGRLKLSSSLLPPSSAVALSDDGRYLAFSSRSRANLWDTQDGKAVFQTEGFRSATWSSAGTLYARFPKKHDRPDQVAALVPEPKNVQTLSYQPAETERLRAGRLLEFVKNTGAPQIIAHDPASNAVLWNRAFVSALPGVTDNPDGTDILLVIPVGSDNGKARLGDAKLAAQAASLKNKADGAIVEVLDGHTGMVKGHAVIALPPTRPNAEAFNVVDDQIYMTSADRTVVYSLSTGAQLRQIFGALVAANNASRRVCLVNREDEAIVMTDEGTESLHLRLGSPIRFAAFQDHGNRLLLLTADQKLHTFQVPGSAAMQTATQPASPIASQ